MNNLEKSIQIALKVHSGQVDLGGHPYILHPLRVLAGVEARTRNYKNPVSRERVLCAAVLHDVLEDCEEFEHESVENEIINIDFFVFETVDYLTRKQKESWKLYIDKVVKSPMATIIKLVDLEENTDLSRIPDPTEIDYKRNRMYAETINKIKFIKEG